MLDLRRHHLGDSDEAVLVLVSYGDGTAYKISLAITATAERDPDLAPGSPTVCQQETGERTLTCNEIRDIIWQLKSSNGYVRHSILAPQYKVALSPSEFW